MSWLIARRELREIFRDHNLVIPLLLLPCLMGVLTGITALSSARNSSNLGTSVTSAVLDQLPVAAQRRLAEQAQPGPSDAQPGGGGLPGIPIEQLTVGTLLKALGLPLFWIVAVALTPAVAADSFVGEKERGTIEPLLAAPVHNRELFAGKLMTAVIPAVLGTWLSTAIFAALVAISHSPYYPAFVLSDGDWLFSTLVIAPLVALLAAGIGALISTRVSSFRVAYQLNGLIALPVILVLIPQAAFLFLVTPRAWSYVAILLAVLDLIVIGWALSIFDRERLLGSL
ncbi:MAG: ABC transporter permease subunit [Chloroflexi bacterium]|nr:ABC transporter permease subunit [Chloroflexota bacterium]